MYIQVHTGQFLVKVSKTINISSSLQIWHCACFISLDWWHLDLRVWIGHQKWNLLQYITIWCCDPETYFTLVLNINTALLHVWCHPMSQYTSYMLGRISGDSGLAHFGQNNQTVSSSVYIIWVAEWTVADVDLELEMARCSSVMPEKNPHNLCRRKWNGTLAIGYISYHS